MGDDYLVLEEGLSGRTSVFPDALHESMDGLSVIYSTLMSHEPVDLLVIMLGTNDTKERLGVNAACIAIGMERLVRKAQSTMCWKDGKPNVLIVCPPHILPEMMHLPASAAIAVLVRLCIWFCTDYVLALTFIPALCSLGISFFAEPLFAKYGGGITPVSSDE